MGAAFRRSRKVCATTFWRTLFSTGRTCPSYHPSLTAGICALRHLRSGCTLLHHNGFDDDGVEGARRAHIAIRTYLSTGIRLAFSPGVRDESKLAMGGEEFIETLPSDLRVGARPFVFFDKEAL